MEKDFCRRAYQRHSIIDVDPIFNDSTWWTRGDLEVYSKVGESCNLSYSLGDTCLTTVSLKDGIATLLCSILRRRAERQRSETRRT